MADLNREKKGNSKRTKRKIIGGVPREEISAERGKFVCRMAKQSAAMGSRGIPATSELITQRNRTLGTGNHIHPVNPGAQLREGKKQGIE